LKNIIKGVSHNELFVFLTVHSTNSLYSVAEGIKKTTERLFCEKCKGNCSVRAHTAKLVPHELFQN